MSYTVVTGNYPRPAYRKMTVTKPYEGAGYYPTTLPRNIVGICNHVTDGKGTLDWYQGFFSTGGQRAEDALVDFMIDRDGVIAEFNDAWGHRAGWANGGADGLEGGGPAFLSYFGNAENFILASTEHIALGTEATWPDAMIESSIKNDAWILDRAGMHWDTLPIHPKYGISTCLHHGEFTGKGGNTVYECAGLWYRTHEDWYLQQVAAALKPYQSPGITVDVPPIVVAPEITYPKGMDLVKATKAFGKLRFHDVNGRIIKKGGFDEKGTISMLWLKHGGITGVFPQAQDFITVADNNEGPNRDDITRQIVTFENGDCLVRRSTRSGWEWL